MTFRRCVVNLVLLIQLSNSFAQNLAGTNLRLKPTTVPLLCNTGDIRVDQDDSNKPKICRSNAWITMLDSAFAGTASVGAGSADTVFVSDGVSPLWQKITGANINTSSTITANALSINQTSSIAGWTFDNDGTLIQTAGSIDIYPRVRIEGSLVVNNLSASIGFVNFIQGPDAFKSNINGIYSASATALSLGSLVVTAASSFGSSVTAAGNFVGNLVGNVTGSLTGLASTASSAGLSALADIAKISTAFAVTPSPCGASTYAHHIAPNGNLTCSAVAFSELSGTASVAQGGTNNGTLSVTAGTVYYGDGSKLMGVAPGTAGQTLISSGSTVGWSSFTFASNNSTGQYTPSAQNIWVDSGQGNSLTISSTGTWILYAHHDFSAVAGVGYGAYKCGWFGATGTNNATAPAVLSTAATVLAGTVGGRVFPATNGDVSVVSLFPLVIRNSQAITAFTVCLSPMTTPSNARWFDWVWAQKVQ